MDNVEPFAREEAEFDRSDRRKVRVRDEIRDRYACNAHKASWGVTPA
jgi:hypothetical protein